MSKPVAPKNPKNNDKGAPYDPSSLMPPLSTAVRNNIIKWVWLQEFGGASGPSISDMRKMPDTQLIDAYTAMFELEGILGAPITGPPNPLSWEEAIVAFLSKLTSAAFWIRAAEVVGGLILITVGLNHLAIKAMQPVMSNPIVKQAVRAAV